MQTETFIDIEDERIFEACLSSYIDVINKKPDVIISKSSEEYETLEEDEKNGQV